MRQLLIKILSPAFRFILRRVLLDIKPSFLREDDTLKTTLHGQGFHAALCVHPSIVFGYHNDRAKGKVFCLRTKIRFLKRCIRVGLLKSPKGHELMERLGIQLYYGNGVDFWFEESHSPIRPYHIPDTPKPNGKIVVYTALTGNYDNVHEILYKEEGVDYLLFTNNPSLTSETWRIILIESGLDNVLLSREVKLLPHKYLADEYEASIYVDANVVIYGEITELTRYLTDKKTFAVSRHSERNTVREESAAIVNLLGINNKAINNQFWGYLKEGFNDNLGLAECNILVRLHKEPTLIKLMSLWWSEFCNGVKRDQISLMPCIEKLSFKELAWMEGGISRHNQFCRVVSHKKV